VTGAHSGCGTPRRRAAGSMRTWYSSVGSSFVFDGSSRKVRYFLTVFGINVSCG
jgi:hypothetical protein